jgi:signal transduction histidine kinase/tetratricopeptide (TPR) repeat protein
VIYSLLPFSRLLGQENRIDSLNDLLANTKGLTRVDVEIELATEYIFSNTKLALEKINSAIENAERANDPYRILKTRRIKGQILYRLEKLDEAIKVNEEAYNLFKSKVSGNPEMEVEFSRVLNNLGASYSLVANYDRALDLHFQALVFREKQGDFAYISDSYLNIGFVYFKLKQYENSLTYYEKSLEAKTIARDSFDLDRLYINMGLSNIHLEKFDQALKSFDSGFDVCGNSCSDEIFIEGEFGLGVVNYKLKNFDESRGHFWNSYNRAKAKELKRWEAENLVYLARIDLQTDQYKEAKDFLIQGESISYALKYNQLLLDHYKEFANLYSAIKDYENATMYQNKYITLKDSLIGEELVKNIAKTQSQFEERENLRTIAQKDEALARQRMLNLAIGTIAFLAALLVFVLYHNNKVRRRVNARLSVTNTKLAEANATIEAQNKQLQSYNDKLEAEVKKATADLLVANTSLEKVNKELDNFIYKTSHDIRGPLASLKGMCNVALMDVKDQLALGYLQKLDETATKLNRILTRLLIINQINSAAIHPEPLDMDKVVDDIILLESKKGLPKGFQFKRDIQRNMIFRSDDALIRIILENLIDNAIKFHNDSGRVVPFVHIKIFIEGPNLHVHVIDNGVGIALENPDRIFQMFTRASEKSGTGGLGLYLIKQAVSRLGGDVGLQLTSEGFTEFYATLPLEIPKELTESSDEQESEAAKASA